MNEATVFLFLNDLTGQYFLLDVIFYFTAKILPMLMVALVAFSLLRNFHKYLLFVIEVATAAVLASYGLVALISHFLPRTRPFIVRDDVNLLLEYKESFSFPSGHTALVFAIATVIYFYNKKIGLLLYALSLVVAFSCVVSGMHWPTDVFAGAVVGVFTAVTVGEVFHFIKSKAK